MPMAMLSGSAGAFSIKALLFVTGLRLAALPFVDDDCAPYCANVKDHRSKRVRL
jgi:hypothetical protein